MVDCILVKSSRTCRVVASQTISIASEVLTPLIVSSSSSSPRYCKMEESMGRCDDFQGDFIATPSSDCWKIKFREIYNAESFILVLRNGGTSR
ncbi:hypothetical protein MANES_02G165401v8 [Manihot esculenta]|uniref:Uncharacterized protein n=1 Tax=Manihot esculenta TaxID=3983 RepID=A0ACB7I607_MANES|nr:hypothetical protein MANES_02G165401v8 [Manihot esculenta]